MLIDKSLYFGKGCFANPVMVAEMAALSGHKYDYFLPQDPAEFTNGIFYRTSGGFLLPCGFALKLIF